MIAQLACGQTYPGGAVKVCCFGPRDRCGKPIIHTRDIGDRVSPAQVSQILGKNKPLQRNAGCKGVPFGQQTPEAVRHIVDCRAACT